MAKRVRPVERLRMRPPSARRGQERLGQEEGPLEVDVEQGVELLLRGLLEAGMNADPGVVDQEVEMGALPLPGEQLRHLLCKGREGGALAHVQSQGMGLNAEGAGLGHHRLRLCGLAAVGDDEVDAFGGGARPRACQGRGWPR